MDNDPFTLQAGRLYIKSIEWQREIFWGWLFRGQYAITKEGKSKSWQNTHLGNNMLREFKTSCARAGIKTHEKLMLHCLRKSWACNLAENGIGNKTLLELGGWSDIRVLDEFYSKASDANKKKAVDVLDRLMGE